MPTIILAGKLIEFEFMKGIPPETHDNDNYCDICKEEKDHVTYWCGDKGRQSVIRACSKHNTYLGQDGLSFLMPRHDDPELNPEPNTPQTEEEALKMDWDIRVRRDKDNLGDVSHITTESDVIKWKWVTSKEYPHLKSLAVKYDWTGEVTA